MKKTPPLELVSTTKINPLAPPSTLGKSGATLWRMIQSEYCISDSGGKAILLQICSACDNLCECDTIIARDGPMIASKTGPKEHPLLKQRLALRAFICRSVQRLGLSLEVIQPVGRPAGANAGLTFENFAEDD